MLCYSTQNLTNCLLAVKLVKLICCLFSFTLPRNSSFETGLTAKDYKSRGPSPEMEELLVFSNTE